MKTIGLIGGMSWESTIPYYRWINQRVNQRLGKLHSAEIVLYSVDFEPIEQLQHAGAWDQAADSLIKAAKRLEKAGAECVLICTNTMHRVYDQVDSAVSLPMLHIADATAEAVVAAGSRTIGLLGTRFTMEQDFYRGRLTDRHGLDVLVPDAADREIVHRTIYDELCLGKVRDDSRQEFVRMLAELTSRGAEGVILGCTEISMLVGPEDTDVPVFDTTEIHALKAADWALTNLEPS